MARYICKKCNSHYPLETEHYFCTCCGLFELDYNPPRFDLSLVDKDEWNIFRYRKFFPVSSGSYKTVTLGEGMTAVVNLDEKVKVKLEYAMPTLSFKDRGAALVIALCKQLGVEKIIQDSSGNAGNSIAAYAARSGIECEIFVPAGTSAKKIAMIEAHGAKITVVEGTRDETAAKCRQKAFSEKIFYASHVYNPFFYQGTKTYIYEVFEQLGKLPDNLIIPVGNGTLFIGAILALEELQNAGLIKGFPNIIAVQSQRCAPLLKAYEEKVDLPQKVNVTETLAEGIAIGEPMRGELILNYIYKYGVTVIPAREETIPAAKDKLSQNGFFVEDTTAASLAAYTDYASNYAVKGDVLIPLCGAGLKSLKS